MATYPFDQPSYEPQTEQTAWDEQSTWPTPQPVETTVPAMDIVDNSEELWVYLELPGFKREEIHVRGDETTLLVSAERPSDLEEGRNVIVQERPKYVERTIQLPSPVDLTNADLTYEDGVCKVLLPKAASERFTELEFH
jgi:HSP20 family protein